MSEKCPKCGAAKDAAMSWSKAAWWRLRATEPTDDGFPEAYDNMDAAFIDAPKVYS